MKKYYEILVPSVIDSSIDKYLRCPSPANTIQIKDKDKIISFLEKENELLIKSLNKLKEYCGEDYIAAVKELEDYLLNFKVEDK